MTAPRVELHVDLASLTTALSDRAKTQVPYASQRALNDLAFEIRQAQVKTIRKQFIIRKSWVASAPRVLKKAEKHEEPQVAIIGIDYEHYFLNKFEDGGTKLPAHSRHLAVPIDAKTSKAGLVPDTYRPRALALHEHVTRTGKVQLKGLQRSFIMQSGPTPGIYQRIGGGGKRRHSHRTGTTKSTASTKVRVVQSVSAHSAKIGRDSIHLLYRFVGSVPIPKSLLFQETAEYVIRERYKFLFAQWLAKAVATAR